MAVSSPSKSTGNVANNGNTNYTPALVVLTSLFFMWGFITSLNDILIPHLKAIFDLNYTQAMLCLLYTSPSPRDRTRSRMPSSAWKKKNYEKISNK